VSSIADDLLGLAKEALSAAGEPEVEVYLRQSERGIARFAIGELGQHMTLTDPFAAIRVARGARVAEVATSRLDREGLTQAIRDAARAARVIPESEGFRGFAGPGDPGCEPLDNLPPRFAAATAEAAAETRVERLAAPMARIAKAGLVSAGSLETRAVYQGVATTRGLARSHASTFATYKVWALETPGAGGAAGFGAHTHRDLSALDIDAQTDRAIHFCQRGRNPVSLEAGAYDVVMAPHAVAELLEWLSIIAFAAPQFEQRTSPLAGRLGERITGEDVTVDEDPLDPSDTGLAAPFDREGVSRRRVSLIEKGVAKGVLYDRIYASRLGASSTGSALPPDGLLGESVGASALHLAPGTVKSAEELAAGIERGLYVCRLHYVNGFLETRRAVMTGLTRDGCFLIEKGKITKPVGNLRFTDSFLEALARADGMTSARAAVPTWWSDAGASVVPAIRIRAFEFNGRSQEPPQLE
jgi:PmbA protein